MPGDYVNSGHLYNKPRDFTRTTWNCWLHMPKPRKMNLLVLLLSFVVFGKYTFRDNFWNI